MRTLMHASVQRPVCFDKMLPLKVSKCVNVLHLLEHVETNAKSIDLT